MPDRVTCIWRIDHSLDVEYWHIRSHHRQFWFPIISNRIQDDLYCFHVCRNETWLSVPNLIWLVCAAVASLPSSDSKMEARLCNTVNVVNQSNQLNSSDTRYKLSLKLGVTIAKLIAIETIPFRDVFETDSKESSAQFHWKRLELKW